MWQRGDRVIVLQAELQRAGDPDYAYCGFGKVGVLIRKQEFDPYGNTWLVNFDGGSADVDEQAPLVVGCRESNLSKIS